MTSQQPRVYQIKKWRKVVELQGEDPNSPELREIMSNRTTIEADYRRRRRALDEQYEIAAETNSQKSSTEGSPGNSPPQFESGTTLSDWLQSPNERKPKAKNTVSPKTIADVSPKTTATTSKDANSPNAQPSRTSDRDERLARLCAMPLAASSGDVLAKRMTSAMNLVPHVINYIDDHHRALEAVLSFDSGRNTSDVVGHPVPQYSRVPPPALVVMRSSVATSECVHGVVGNAVFVDNSAPRTPSPSESFVVEQSKSVVSFRLSTPQPLRIGSRNISPEISPSATPLTTPTAATSPLERSVDSKSHPSSYPSSHPSSPPGFAPVAAPKANNLENKKVNAAAVDSIAVSAPHPAAFSEYLSDSAYYDDIIVGDVCATSRQLVSANSRPGDTRVWDDCQVLGEIDRALLLGMSAPAAKAIASVRDNIRRRYDQTVAAAWNAAPGHSLVVGEPVQSVAGLWQVGGWIVSPVGTFNTIAYGSSAELAKDRILRDLVNSIAV